MNSIPHGLCRCGCGQSTPLADRTSTERGWIKGQPINYIHGHNPRKALRLDQHLAVDRGYETPCWIWQGSKSGLGYGRMRYKGETRLAHRVYYIEMRGLIPPDLDLDHLCRVPACVNPNHLEPVPHAENVRRGNAAKIDAATAQRIRQARAETGLSYRKLADVLGLSPSIVRGVIFDNKWS
jgi:hypothetical protein